MDKGAVLILTLRPEDFEPGDDVILFGDRKRVMGKPEPRTNNVYAVAVSEGDPFHPTIQYFTNLYYRVERLDVTYFVMTIADAYHAELAWIEAQTEWNRAAEHERQKGRR